MSLIINIRGANGSGKTTLAKSLLKPNAPLTTLIARPIRPRGERGSMKKDIVASCARNIDGDTVAVIGRYDTNCGGCDGYTWPGSHDQIVEAVSIAASRFPYVVFEGVTITSSYGRYRDLAHRVNLEGGHETEWIMLDFGLDELVKRVQKRTPRERDADGMARLRKNIDSKIRTMELTRPKLLAEPLVRQGIMDHSWFTDTDLAKEHLHRLVRLVDA